MFDSLYQSSIAFVQNNGRGVLVALLVAITAQFLSDHYGTPSMLLALLLGMTLHFLSEESQCRPGIELSARTVLRVGVALLGIRISFQHLVALGPQIIGVVVLSVVATIAFGYIGARLLGRGWRLGLLTGGSVAICGASAAMAIAAVLPKNQYSERNLLFTVLSVTLLSTIAMVIYPITTQLLELDAIMSGVFIGGTIHDVAQVVGAGFSISTEAGDVATLVKLIRVSLLAPVVLLLAMFFQNQGLDKNSAQSRPPLVPVFIIAFFILATLNSLGVIPSTLASIVSDVSRWALLTAIAVAALILVAIALLN